MRKSGTLAEGYNAFKGWPGGAALAHLELNFGGNFVFADPGLQEFERTGEHIASQNGRLAHYRQLRCIFLRAVSLHKSRSGNTTRAAAGSPFQMPELRHRQP